jgi:sec-independent protein translocase protein TatB
VNLFDINGGEFLILVVLAIVLIGPERLPHYAAQLARVVRKLRSFVSDAKDRVSEELGPELTDVDWSKLDPRQDDPRKIVRDALADVGPILPTVADLTKPSSQATTVASTTVASTEPSSAAAPNTAQAPTPVGGPAPFDPEAT